MALTGCPVKKPQRRKGDHGPISGYKHAQLQASILGVVVSKGPRLLDVLVEDFPGGVREGLLRSAQRLAGPDRLRDLDYPRNSARPERVGGARLRVESHALGMSSQDSQDVLQSKRTGQSLRSRQSTRPSRSGGISLNRPTHLFLRGF